MLLVGQQCPLIPSASARRAVEKLRRPGPEELRQRTEEGSGHMHETSLRTSRSADSGEEHMDKAISRRRMLKRIGAGAAVAWSAPVLTSLSTPAFAQYPPSCPEPCAACFDGNAQLCGVDSVRPGVPCFCSQTFQGDCVCTANDSCGEWGTCTTSSDCPSGFVCKPVGCTSCSTAPGQMNCARPCGTPLPARAPRRTTGRRMSG
jgi:hypothetical protein